jgi:hypothetical protein
MVFIFLQFAELRIAIANEKCRVRRFVPVRSRSRAVQPSKYCAFSYTKSTEKKYKLVSVR